MTTQSTGDTHTDMMYYVIVETSKRYTDKYVGTDRQAAIDTYNKNKKIKRYLNVWIEFCATSDTTHYTPESLPGQAEYDARIRYDTYNANRLRAGFHMISFERYLYLCTRLSENEMAGIEEEKEEDDPIYEKDGRNTYTVNLRDYNDACNDSSFIPELQETDDAREEELAEIELFAPKPNPTPDICPKCDLYIVDGVCGCSDIEDNFDARELTQEEKDLLDQAFVFTDEELIRLDILNTAECVSYPTEGEHLLISQQTADVLYAMLFFYVHDCPQTLRDILYDYSREREKAVFDELSRLCGYH